MVHSILNELKKPAHDHYGPVRENPKAIITQFTDVFNRVEEHNWMT